MKDISLGVRVDVDIESRSSGSVEKEIERMENSVKRYGDTIIHLQEKLRVLKRLSTSVFRDMKNVGSSDLKALENYADTFAEEINRALNTINNDESLLGTSRDKTVNDIEKIIEANDRLQQRIAELRETSENTGGIVSGSTVTDEANLNRYIGARKQAWNTIGSYAMSISNKSWNAFKRSGKIAVNSVVKTLNLIGTGFSTIWQRFIVGGKKSTSIVAGYLRQMISVFSIYKLFDIGKQAIDFSSDMIEVRNVIHGAFGNAKNDILEFTNSAVSAFGLTELQANKMIGTFGGMLKASNISGEANIIMSKNLTALAGDVASFYNMNVDEVLKKLQSGMSGQVQALRSFGINANVANMQAYALANGINKSWKELNLATQQTLRYNYILEHLALAQGDFSRTADSWANKVHYMSLAWKQFLSVMGGFAIKALYPVVLVLNQILNVALKASQLLAEVFHVTPVDLEDMFGVGGNLEGIEYGQDDNIDTTGIDDYTDSVNDAVNATDDYSKSTEDAGDNLQSFDRLNNITTDSIKDSNKAKEEGTKLNNDDVNKMLGGSLIDPLSYFEKIKGPGEYVNEWLEDWIKTLTDKKWYKAGNDLAKLITKGLKKVDDALSNEDTLISANKFGTGLGEFINGILYETEMFSLAGKTLADGVNLFTTWFNALFDEISFTQAGRDFNAFIRGFVDNINADDLGKALGQKFKAIVNFTAGLLEDKETFEVMSDKFSSGLLSFVNTIELDEAIPVFSDLAMTLIKTLGDTFSSEAFDVLGEDITNGIDTAIDNIKPEELSNSIGGIVDGILDILDGMLDADWEEAGKKFGDTVDGLVDNGTLGRLINTFFKILDSFYKFAKSAITNIDWLDILNVVLDEIGKAWGEGTFGEKFLTILFGALGLAGVTGKIVGGVIKIKLLVEALSALHAVSTGATVAAGASTVAGSAGAAASGGILSSILSALGPLAGILATIITIHGIVSSISKWTEDISNSNVSMSNLMLTMQGRTETSEIAYDRLKNNEVVFSAATNFKELKGDLQDIVDTYLESENLLRDAMQENQVTKKDNIKDLTSFTDELKSAYEKIGYSDSEFISKLEEKTKKLEDLTKHKSLAELYNEQAIALKTYGEKSSQYENLSKRIEEITNVRNELYNMLQEGASEAFGLLGGTTLFNESDIEALNQKMYQQGKDISLNLSKGISEDDSIKLALTSNIEGLSDEELNESIKTIGTNISSYISQGYSENLAIAQATNDELAKLGVDTSEYTLSQGQLLGDGVYEGYNSALDLQKATREALLEAENNSIGVAESAGDAHGKAYANSFNTAAGSALKGIFNVGAGIASKYGGGGSTYSGAPTGYTYNAQSYDIATASAKSALGEYHDYAMRANTFSDYTYGTRSTYIPRYYDRTESYVSSTRRNVSSYNEEKLLDKLSAVANVARYNRSTNDTLYAEISIGNKQIDDYIVDVVRRNKYRLA